MTPERFREVEALFDEIVELPADQQRARLDQACGDDDELRREVESLLAALASAPARIHDVISAHAEQLTHPPMTGERLGPYRVLEALGEGGMGVVYRAERDDGEYRTQVAIKLLRGGLSPDALARFRDERQILAKLEHPGIVRMLDGGTTDGGQPYLVMEYVDGVPLTQHARARELSLASRIELFGKVAAAVAFAHQQLIVHRDLKPSNVLVTADGAPKLLDFGIAKLLVPHASREAHTRTGLQLLTPEYASPEQLRGEPITTATDIYSLGALLYELCTDQKAQPLGDGDSVEVLLRAILDGEPRRPSTVAPPSRRRALRGDLDNIILKALHKRPAQRYASVEQLIDDLERHLGGLPVKAREATFGYRAGKFLRRNAALVGAGLLVLGTSITATVISLDQARRADAQAEAAKQQRELAEAQAALAREQAQVARAQGRRVRDAMRVGAAQHAALVAKDPTLAVQLLRELESDPAESFGWLAAMPHASTPSFVTTQLLRDSEPANVASWSPDGTRLATAGSRSTALVWDADGTLLATIGPGTDRAGAIAFAPDGSMLATVAPAGAAVWRTDGTLLATIGDQVSVGSGQVIAWSPDGARFVTAGAEQTASLWQLDGTLIATLHGHGATVSSAMWSSDGTRLLTASQWDPTARLWRADGTLVAKLGGHRQGIRAAAFSPDGAWIVTGSDDFSARVWQADGTLAHVLDGHEGPVFDAAWSPDSQQLALASRDRSISVWRRDGTRVTSMSGHTGAVIDIAWSPGGQWIASASEDRSARVWRADGTLVATLLGHQNQISSISWRPHPDLEPTSEPKRLDDERLLTSSYGEPARVWQAERSLPRALLGHHGDILDAAFSPDGARVATAAEDQDARVWQTDGSALATLHGHVGSVRTIAWSPAPAGDRLLTVGDDHTARVWQTDGTLVATLGQPSDAELLSASWGPVTIATTNADGTVRLWHDDGRLYATLDGHQDAVPSAAWSADGRLLTASWDKTARVWASDGTPQAVLEGHEQAVQAAAWRPAGDRIATTSMDRSARIWNTDGTLVTRLDERSLMEAVVWSPDGTRLVTTGTDRIARIWAADGTALVRLAAHADDISAVAWSHDGARLLTASLDGSVRLWSADGLLLATLTHEWSVRSASFDRDDTHVLTTVNHRAQVWSIDTDALLRGYWLSTPRCPDTDERQRVLAEPRSDAERGEAACLAMQTCLAARPYDECLADFTRK